MPPITRSTQMYFRRDHYTRPHRRSAVTIRNPCKKEHCALKSSRRYIVRFSSLVEIALRYNLCREGHIVCYVKAKKKESEEGQKSDDACTEREFFVWKSVEITARR